MKISIKLQGSSLVGIDIYELEDSSLETTLRSIVGTYTPSLTTRGGVSTAAVGLEAEDPTVTVEHIRADGSMWARADGMPDLSTMSDEDWEEHLNSFLEGGNAERFTRWLDGVFFPNGGSEVVSRVFRRAHTVYHLVNTYPGITRRISLNRWLQLTYVLGGTGALPEIAEGTARTYYNKGLRLTSV